MDILSVVRAYGLPEEFPRAVMEEIKSIPEKADSSDIGGRKDLRGVLTVTIDGEEAKDLDDAISIERAGDGYRLGVHIADVSHYVREYTALDAEALRRSTSVYLVDRVIPMLPHRLSNGICSLNEGEDRLTLSCLMDIDSQGNVVGHEIAETVIRSDRRMTYTAVNAIVTEHDPEVTARYAELADMFLLMKELADILRKKRHARGSIDFDFPESKIVLDEKGRPIEIKPYERNAATRIIEDFMLLANETVAEDYFWQEVPFLYRTHEKPDEDRMKRLGTFINNFGYTLRMPGGEVHPKELQKLLDKVEGTPEEALISRLTLRSMEAGKISLQQIQDISGFQPLIIRALYISYQEIPRICRSHRIIKESLHGGLTEETVSHYERILPQVASADLSSGRRADEAERRPIS